MIPIKFEKRHNSNCIFLPSENSALFSNVRTEIELKGDKKMNV